MEKETSPAPLTVRGTIYDEWIEPMPEALVMVFDQDIRHERLLGQHETDAAGVYHITYNKREPDREDKGGADIVVRLYDRSGGLLTSSGVFFNSPASLKADLNLGPRPFMGPSDFVKAVATIRPFIGKLTIAELTENATTHDLSFLISKTGITPGMLLQLVAAFRFEQWASLNLRPAAPNPAANPNAAANPNTSANPNMSANPAANPAANPNTAANPAANPNPGSNPNPAANPNTGSTPVAGATSPAGAEVFFGILAQNNSIGASRSNSLPGNVEAAIEQAYIHFWDKTVPAMMTSLQEAAMQNIVTYSLLRTKDSIQAQLQQYKNDPPAVPGGTVVLPIVYNQIGLAGLNAGQQQVFLENYRPSAVSTSFWNDLSADPQFSGTTGQTTIAKLQTVLQLSDWSAGNTDLVGYLMDKQHIQTLTDLGSLVGNTVGDWVNIVQSSGTVPSDPTVAPATPAANSAQSTPGTNTSQSTHGTNRPPSTPGTVQAIATAIAAGIEKTYPTQVLTARINRNTTYNPTNKSYITGVLGSSDFDICKTGIGAYLDTHVQNNPVPQGADRQTIAYQVMGIQRIYKATRNADASVALLTDNVQSARQIYAMGRNNFVSRYTNALGGDTTAGAIYDQAEQIHAGAAHLTGQLLSRVNNPATHMLPDYNDSMEKTKLLTEYPDLGDLFGMAASHCKCADCESFLGIPAYLADLLDYLFQRGAAGGKNARALLMANDYKMNGLTWRRRPDIGDIDLDCANTDTELPYIDITNELLEDYIIPPIDAIRLLLKGNADTVTEEFLIWLATNLAPGKIKPTLYKLLMQIGQDPKTPICNIDLLTPEAIVSTVFFTDGENYPAWMMQGYPLIAEWVIRDRFITLKVSLMTSQRYISQLPKTFGSDLIDVEASATIDTATAAQPDPQVDQATYNKLSSVYSAQTFQPTGDGNVRGNGNDRTGKVYFALIVQETHQTHLTTAEIDANPEYTNTNVYNSLSDPFNSQGNNKWDLYPTLIPIRLPFDLYFAEANTFLDKLGKKRYDLMDIYRRQGAGSLDGIVSAYMGLSAGDAYIIFNARVQVPPAPDPQKKFWGSLDTVQPGVNLFLTASGLTFEQLEVLLTLSFINPTGDSYIAGTKLGSGKPGISRLPPPTVYDACNTALMVITNMTSEKFDHINRFLRLWRKLSSLTSISMRELDACIMCPALGNGKLDRSFGEAMYYFLRLMSQLDLSATRLLTFYQDIDTGRSEDLYRQLFQNRQISNPLVPAFHLPLAGTAAITDTQANPGAVPVILTACGITPADLTAILALDAPAYTLLTLENLSFIYSCGLLAGALGIPVADLFTLAGLLHTNPLHQPFSSFPAATPAATFTFVTQFNELQQAGFTVDALNYVLTNRSTATTSLIPDSTAVVTGLENIRGALQAAVTATTVVPDPQGTLLTKWLADPQLGWDPSLASKVLSILGQTDAGAYTAEVQENLRMFQNLRTRYGLPSASAFLDRLPDIAFPAAGIGQLQYDNSNEYLLFLGAMTQDQSNYLQQLPGIDAAGKTAIQQLYLQSQSCPISAVPAPGSGIPAWVSANLSSITQNAPAFSCGQGALGFTGTMSLPVYNSLLAQSPDPGYACALGQLLVASQGVAAPAKTFVRLSALPAIAFPDAAAASLSWANNLLSFTGAMSAADCRALLGLSNDAAYQTAICRLFITAQPGQTVSAALTSLPSGWTILPDLSTVGNITATPGATPSSAALSFAGQMTPAVRTALSSLSALSNWPANIAALFSLSQSTATTTVPIPALPVGVTDASFAPYGLTNTTPGGQTTPILLTYTGVMSDYILEGLLGLSTDAGWAPVMTSLYQNSRDTAVTGVTLPQPSGINTAAFAGYKVTYTASGASMTLSYTGQMQPQTKTDLLALSADTTYAAAIGSLFNQVSALFAVSLPAILIPLPDAGLAGVAYTNGAIVFNGTPDVVCNDGFNLGQLSPDTRYRDAIAFIYNQPPLPAGTVGAVLSAMPPVSLPSSMAISYSGGLLAFTGQMLTSERDQLLGLSANASWQTAIAQLYAQSQLVTLASVPALAGGAFPDGVTKTQLSANGVNLFFSGATYVLSFTGQMSAARQTALLALVPPSTNDDYTKAIQTLYSGSQTVVMVTTPLAALPPVSLSPAAVTAGWNYDSGNGVLYYTGAIPITSSDLALVNSLNTTDPDFQTAVGLLAGLASNPGAILVFAPPPATPFTSSGIVLANGASITYQDGTLAFTGPMSFEDYLGLLSLSTDPAWQAAVTNVYIASQPVAPGVTVHSTDYFALPPIGFPLLYANQLSFIPSTGTLTLHGYITPADVAVLSSAGISFPWQQALSALDNTITNADGPVGSDFTDLYVILLDGSTSAPPAPADRYAFFLEAISADYLALKEADALAAQISSNCGVAAPVASVMTMEVFTAFTDPSFVGNSKAINPDPEQFPLAQWYLKLMRMGFLVNSFNLGASDTEWLLEHGSSIDALELNAWPAPTAPLSFASWEVLNAIASFQRTYPPLSVPDPANPGKETQLSVYTLLSAAMTIAADIIAVPQIPCNPGAYLAQLAQLTKWDPVQLAYLLDVGEPNPPNTTLNPLNFPDSGMPPVGCIAGLTDISLLQRLAECFTVAAKLKVVPSRCVGWVTDPITDKIATDIKQALKSLYPDSTSWLSAVQPLMNTLRQERRDALVEYLGSNTVTNPFGKFDIFPDDFSVYGNFLIDVEMNACQPTTRTIQAYCSIQLFVQRCFLNLEYPNVRVDAASDPDWLQLGWMSTFESWYEARYIFLYPENFILPQTLPGQSPFFQDMQNDLTQGAVTEQIVETAFGNYLESLDEVARLEVKGMWYDDPGNTLYVFARTYGGDPAIYFFRTLNPIGVWSAWQQVTADISGDHIIPIMQNGRLFLYWPIFTQTSDAGNTTQTQTSSDGKSMSSAPPDKYWKVQMAFSEYLNGKWTGKKVSKDYAATRSIGFSTDGTTWAPDTSDFVFIPLDVPPSVPASASDAQKFGSVIQSLTMNNTMIIGIFINNTQYDSDGNPGIGVPGEGLKLLESTNLFNAFVLDPLRGFPTGAAFSDILGTDTAIAFLFPDDSNRFKDTWYYDMLVTGKLPLTPQQNGTALATLLSNSDDPACNTLLSLQMNLWAKWFFVNNGYVKPEHLGILMPFFFQDSARTFFVKQLSLSMPGGKSPLYPPYYYYPDAKLAFASTGGNAGQLSNLWNQTHGWSADSGPLYEFDNFYHPYAHEFIRLYAQRGIGSILTRPIQLTGDYTYGLTPEVLDNPIINFPDNPGYQPFSFGNTYHPDTGLIVNASITEVGYPLDQVDFDLFSSYGRYNWELFFHGVLMSAMQLSQNQQFAAADAWFKCIFDPTDTSTDTAPQKFWVTKPFFENTSAKLSIDELILSYEANPASQPAFWESVLLWRNDPYDPHMLAQLRTTPYQYTTFMKYLDNLIAWANFYYAEYTMESVNRAIQLFMLALECLGPKPQAIPPVVGTPVCSYYQLELNLEVLAALDGKDGYLSDPIVQFENLLPPVPWVSPKKSGKPGEKKIQMLPGLYFCIPPNPVLMGYWDTIETQLTRIRNCMNIKGQFQPLSPFPNVPGMGNGEGGPASDWGGILPNYRFAVMIQKATELCNEVKSLGASLLSALEKQDAEQLALLRASQEVSVQQAIDKIKQMEITDANYSLTSLQNYASLLNDKIGYYNGLIQGGLIPLEQQALAMSQFSLSLEEPIATGTQLSMAFKQLPNFTMGINGAFGSPAATITFGGVSLGAMQDSQIEMLSFMSHFSDRSATIANTNAGYSRRLAEWNYQLTNANDELTQTNTQIQAARNKIDIATQDEENQQLLIRNAEDVAGFLQNKYTNQQLYTWMVSQLSNVYFKSYQLAYTIAKQAEICFRYELGIPGTSYINYGYWDSLHKGLLCGENLLGNLKQMEMDYYNRNLREYELTRQISLAQLDPVALLQLKAGGACFLDIPEELFDLDYPGQYFRRIRHIAVTLPGVVGPYTPVCLKMTLMANSLRIDNRAGTAANYPRNTNSKGMPTNDSRFLDNVAMTQYIATSTAVNDNGLFEMNMKDERYVPFEGAGAISSWQLQLTGVYPQFDPGTITDLIIHFKYTAREGGPALQEVAAASLQKRLGATVTANGMVLSRAFSARRDFPTQWYKFLNPVAPTDPQQLEMDITSRFPFFTQGLNIRIDSVLVLADTPAGSPGPAELYISGVRLGGTLVNLGTNPEFGNMLYDAITCKDGPGVWKLTNGNGQGTPPPPITATSINDLVVIFNYSLS